ncbi:alpha/beta hydrolase [Halogeometricum sp. S1BR25-6]|uniref:Alpha/beta hydrolase n=1 Tax=Halogeometricum salsisoli TaxID=2950536 RepID=A0ABU2GBM5_9EURY|nr:alpha/beta hydrolase [Halogeometricum sp. S1BR25-6]MDS0297876.1 alpha/beta hydrolase [Halogeometricum sp. S1BR25-6]
MAKTTPPESGGKTETVTSADGTEIAYERSGSGPPLVLVHGGMFDRSIWDIGDIRSTLAEQTTVYAMDRRNHGDSASSDDCRPDAQIADVVAVVESIDDPVHLLGHSSGANYALWAALRTDNLRSVIPHEPAAPPDEDIRAVLKETMEKTIALIDKGQNEQALTMVVSDFAKFTSGELTEVRSSPVWDAHVDIFHQTLLPELEAAGEFDWWDLTPFEDLSTPTLLLVGSESPHTSLAERLHEIMPNSRLASLEGYGHAAHLVAPDRYTDEVLSFISDVD